MEPSFNDKPKFNHLADELIVAGCYAEAQTLLEAALQEMPVGWKPVKDDDRALSASASIRITTEAVCLLRSLRSFAW
jgi:hypothetical protein